MEKLSKERISALTGATHRTVTKRLQAGGVEPIAREGKSDLFDSEVALRAVLLDADAADGRLDLQQERAALAREQQTFYRLKNEALAGTLVERSVFIAALETLLTTLRQQFLALPQRLASVCVGGTPQEIHHAADTEIRRILEAFATGAIRMRRKTKETQ